MAWSASRSGRPTVRASTFGTSSAAPDRLWCSSTASGGAARTWLAVAPALAERHRVIVPDLPGHAAAAVPRCPISRPFADVVHGIAEREDALPPRSPGTRSAAGGRPPRGALRQRHARSCCWARPGSARPRGGRSRARLTSLLQPGRRLAPFASWISATPFRRRACVRRLGRADAGALPPASVGRCSRSAAAHGRPGASRALVRDDVRRLLPRVRCRSVVAWGTRDAQVPVARRVRVRPGARHRAPPDRGLWPPVDRRAAAACVDAILPRPRRGSGARRTPTAGRTARRGARQRLDAEPLGRVVAGGDEVEPELAGEVERRLGGLAGQEEVVALARRLGRVAGGAARDDRHALDGRRALQERGRLAAEHARTPGDERRGSTGGSSRPPTPRLVNGVSTRRPARVRAARCCRSPGARRARGGRRRA